MMAKSEMLMRIEADLKNRPHTTGAARKKQARLLDSLRQQVVTNIDITGIAAHLAALLGEPPSQGLETAQDLLGYAEEVGTDLGFRVWSVWDIVGDIQELIDPETATRERHEGNARLDRLLNRDQGLAQRREWGVKAKKQKRAETTATIMAAVRKVGNKPKHNQASIIAEKTGIPVRTVRHVLRLIRNAD
jgi:hypothetical protein